MTIEDILKPVYPVQEYTHGNITTRIQTGPDFKVTRSIKWMGRNIELPSPLDMFSKEEATRLPTPTVSLSPVGCLEAVRKPVELEGD